MKSLQRQRSSLYLWWGLGSLATIATLLFAAGFGYVIQSVVLPNGNPSSLNGELREVPDASNQGQLDGIHIVTLGDSLTRGTGDATGKGYTGVIRQKLEQLAERDVFLVPYAINGYRSDELLRMLEAQKGVQASIEQADIVLLTIGANDLFAVGEAVEIEAAIGNLEGTVARIEQIFKKLMSLNKEAQIIYSGLYNPFVEIDTNGAVSRFVLRFNQAVAASAVSYPNITVVPMHDLFAVNTDSYLAGDYFHPNTLGYQRMAERIMQVLRWEDQ